MKHYTQTFSDPMTEKMIISTALIKYDALLELIELEPEVFYHKENRIVYEAMKALHNEGEYIDSLSLRNKLIESGKYTEINGDVYLSDLVSCASVVNFRYAGRTLTKLMLRRKLKDLSLNMHDLINSPGIENELILNEIQVVVKEFDLLSREDYTEIKDLMPEDFKDYDVTGQFIPTGFKGIDSKIIGLFKGELIILGARPGRGKTALALNCVMNMAKDNNCAFISLEMPKKQLGMRALSSWAMVNGRDLRQGKLDGKVKQLEEARDRIKKLKLAILNCNTIDQIEASARKLVQLKDLKFLVVDYLQLVKVTGKGKQRYVEVGEVSRRLKLLAIELDIPILAMCQLSRECETRAPHLSDLRESGDIEQDADVVLFLHESEEDNTIKLLFAKSRSDEAGVQSELIFKKEFTRFFDIDYYM